MTHSLIAIRILARGALTGGALTLAIGLTTACDSSGEDPYALPKKSRNINEISQAKSDATPEELAEARKKAGFKTTDEIAAENAKMFEKGAREYVKTRMKEYRAMVDEFRSHLEDIEKDAPKWAQAKDPAKAFEKFETAYEERAKEFTKNYDELTGHGAEGGNVQVALGRAFRTWEDLKSALGPDLAENERFATTLTEIRKDLDEVAKLLDDVDADDTLKINETYGEKQKGKKAEEEGEATDE